MLRNPLTSGDGGSFRTSEESAAGWYTEGKVERILHRGQCQQHPPPPTQPEMLVCLPTEMGGGWMLSLRFRGQTPGRGLELKDPRERTAVTTV